MTTPETYIIGGYQTDFARNWTKENKHFSALMYESVNGALEHCDIEAADVDSAHVGNFAAELYCMQGHLGAFFVEADPAFSGIPTMRHEAACASGSLAILAASAEIEAGRYDLQAVVGIEQMKTVSPAIGGDYLGTAAWYEDEAKGVEFPFPKLFGRLGDEYDARYGLLDEHLAEISRINYANAKTQPERPDPHVVHEQGPCAEPRRRQRADRRPHPHLRLLTGHRRCRHRVPRLPGVCREVRRPQENLDRQHPAHQGLGPQHCAPTIRGQGGREQGQRVRASACPLHHHVGVEAGRSVGYRRDQRHRDARLLHHVGVHGHRPLRAHQAGRQLGGHRVG